MLIALFLENQTQKKMPESFEHHLFLSIELYQ